MRRKYPESVAITPVAQRAARVGDRAGGADGGGFGGVEREFPDKPLAIDLFCGLGGFSDGFIVEGYEVIGYDIEAHEYGDQRYPGRLIIQDVLTLHGAQFKDAACIVASPPCQAYSYMAMPWSLAKAKAAAIRADTTGQALEDLNRLFHACFRIQAEASLAAGRHIPMVVENVRGAQPWVGRARYNFGSFYLWGDVPALMPMAVKATKAPGMGHGWKHPDDPRHKPGLDFTRLAGKHAEGLKVPGFRFDGSKKCFQQAAADGLKNDGGSWFNVGPRGEKGHNNNPARGQSIGEGIKQPGIGGKRSNGKGDAWFQDGAARHGSKSNSRKAASAMIAKIPLPLCRHIAAVYRPRTAV